LPETERFVEAAQIYHPVSTLEASIVPNSIAHSGETLGKNLMFWPFGPRCGPKGGIDKKPDYLRISK